MHPHLHLGTSGFSAQRFDTVEIDATFYRIPSAAQVRNWAATAPGFPG